MTGGGQKVQCLYHIMDKKSIFQNHCDDNANGEVEWLVNFEGLKLLCEYFRVAFPYLICHPQLSIQKPHIHERVNYETTSSYIDHRVKFGAKYMVL